jgi:hypothetical protein
MQSFDDFKRVLDRMVNEGILAYNTSGRVIVAEDKHTFEFFCSLIFPLIDTYWIVIMYAYQLGQHYFCEENRLYDQIQSFAYRLFEDHIILYFESCSLETIKNSVGMFT